MKIMKNTFVLTVILLGFPLISHAQTAPTPITNCQELQNIGRDRFTLMGNYVLANDIDCSETRNWNSGQGFVPIGVDLSSSIPRDFTGTLDGQGYTISNLYINFPNQVIVGLFVRTYGNITHLRLQNIDVTGYRSVGGLTGEAYGGNINRIFVSGKIQSTAFSTLGTGGVVGYGNSMISQCVVHGSVKASGSGPVGGVLGSAGAINYNTISNSYSLATVEGYDPGGLYGDAYAAEKSYAAGRVISRSSSSGAFGLGKVTYGVNTNSYWDKEATQQPHSRNVADEFGKTTAEMKTRVTFAGWDFENVWQISEGFDYPSLKWEGKPVVTLLATSPETPRFTLNHPLIDGNHVLWQENDDTAGNTLNFYDLTTKQTKKLTQIDASFVIGLYTKKSDNIIAYPDMMGECRYFDLSTEQVHLLPQQCQNIHVDGNYIVYLGFGESYLHDMRTGQETVFSQMNMTGISGSKVVYVGQHPYPKIFVYDINTQQHEEIATRELPFLNEDATIGGDFVVWTEGENISGQDYQINFYLYDMVAKQKRMFHTYMYTGNDTRTFLKIDGEWVVWQEVKDGQVEIYTYNIDKNKVSLLTKVSSFPSGLPRVSNDRVVWSSQGEKIYMADLVAKTRFNLTVASPTGGRVMSDPYAIDCGQYCSVDLEKDSMVTLRATANSGYSFAGWSGDCSGSAATCTLAMNAAKNVMANFSLPDTVAPIVSNLSPNGTLPYGTTQTNITAVTNENAVCKYEFNKPGIAFDAMRFMFSSTGTQAHTSLFTSLTPRIVRDMYVKCRDNAGNISRESMVSFTVGLSATDTTPPPVVSNLTATVLSSTSVKLEWNYSETNSLYRVYQNDKVAAMLLPWPAPANGRVTWVVENLQPGTTYQYKVVAFDGSYNMAAPSAPISVTTP